MNHTYPSVSLPSEILDQVAIPHAYFTWWAGLAALCQHNDEAQCEDMLVRGTFDGALMRSRHLLRGGIVNIDTALKYCARMLRSGGICSDTLPQGLYYIYRERMKQMCGTGLYSKGPRYLNPYQESDATTTMSVSFSELEVMQYVHSAYFNFFLWLILILWYMNLIGEAQELVQMFDFLTYVKVVNEWPILTPTMRHSRMGHWLGAQTPSARPAARKIPSRSRSALLHNESTPLMQSLWVHLAERSLESGKAIEIKQFARPHFYTCLIIASVRLIILVLIAYAGTHFLVSNTTLLDLLLNALALAFIFDLDEFMFSLLLSDASKDLLEMVAPLRYESCIGLPKGVCTHILSERVFWGIVVIPAVSFLVVWIHLSASVSPMLEALNCLCMQGGDRCLENVMFHRAWWDDYWSKMAALRR